MYLKYTKSIWFSLDYNRVMIAFLDTEGNYIRRRAFNKDRYLTWDSYTLEYFKQFMKDND